jgi:hypothetical protein
MQEGRLNVPVGRSNLLRSDRKGTRAAIKTT